jgi:dGTPase
MMKWEKLLNPVRIRELFAGSKSDTKLGDLRTNFDRDYGRTIFSTPVRRLQDKAQVFPLVTDDFVRTRLTHSLEVSSVARGLGAWVGKWLVERNEVNAQLKDETKAAVETIAATCAMLHDLGNPPFGHAGEEAINEWCKTYLDVSKLFPSKQQLALDFLGWNGNAQTIRLVGKLQVLSDEYGLNLTCATLSATCKYVSSSDQVRPEVHDQSKVGYFFSENQLISAVQEATGTGQARHPITLLVEASDDIVYACVDLEDGIKKRLITWEQLAGQLLSLTQNSELTKEVINDAEKKIGNSLKGHARDEGMVQAFRTYAIIKATIAAFDEFKKSYPQIIEGNYHGELVKQSSTATLIKACKTIGRKVVYECDEVLKVELTGRKVIQDLLAIFWEGAESESNNFNGKPFAKKAFALMSENYRKVFQDAVSNINKSEQTAGQWNTYYRIQLICDYIAGMTDSFATNLHRKLTNG